MSTTIPVNVPPGVRPLDGATSHLLESGNAPEFRVLLELDDVTLRLVRQLQCGGAPVVRTIAWNASYARPADAADA